MVAQFLKTYFRIVFAAFGAGMILFSEVLSMLPIASSETWQLLGLGLFMFGVIFQLIITQQNIDEKDTVKPKLFLRFEGQEIKPVHHQRIFRSLDGEQQQFQSEKKGDYAFAMVSISNEPDDQLRGLSAQNATAEIRYKSLNNGNENRIEYGRWWDKDIPLFPRLDNPDMEEIKALKRVDINPGHPEILIVAFKELEGEDIHAFYFTDHKKIWEKLERRMIGKPPIEVEIILRGQFETQTFAGNLSLDEKGKFEWTNIL